MTTFIKVRDYDKIKKGEKIEIIVEAKNRLPMLIYVYQGVPTPTGDSDYENAIFNGERH